ncbi:hypothetical protein PI124_g10447 [Phytophthora idaei]|nr:hypothetical protein PI126_g21215 [Phytophthora idaei]KAG3244798.1 hypothetical protein PI124_g10447 [Phytophthora idaei]
MLHEINQFLGAAFAPSASGSPYSWHEFASAVARIEFRSVSWSIALHEVSQVAEARPPAFAPPLPQAQVAPHTPAPPRSTPGRTAHELPGGIPANIRSIIPRDADGPEPCLKFFGGGMCDGGTRDTCASHERTYVWSGDLPAAFIAKRFGKRCVSCPRRL